MKKIIKCGIFLFFILVYSNSLSVKANTLNKIEPKKVTETNIEKNTTIYIHRGEKVTVQLTSTKSSIYSIRIHNPVGRIIGRFKTQQQKLVVDTKRWRSGIYFIVISENGKYKERRKIVVS